MMMTRLSSKGQIILPKAIRDQHHWSTGETFSVEETKEGILLVPIKQTQPIDISEVAGSLSYSGKAKSLKDMENAIKKGAKGKL